MRAETVTVVFDRKKNLAKTDIGKVELCIYLGRTERKFIKAFNFKAFRSSTAIGTDLLGQQDATLTQGDIRYR